eukprot:5552157-Prymnesium_polylepis.1
MCIRDRTRSTTAARACARARRRPTRAGRRTSTTCGGSTTVRPSPVPSSPNMARRLAGSRGIPSRCSSRCAARPPATAQRISPAAGIASITGAPTTGRRRTPLLRPPSSPSSRSRASSLGSPNGWRRARRSTACCASRRDAAALNDRTRACSSPVPRATRAALRLDEHSRRTRCVGSHRFSSGGNAMPGRTLRPGRIVLGRVLCFALSCANGAVCIVTSYECLVFCLFAQTWSGVSASAAAAD